MTRERGTDSGIVRAYKHGWPRMAVHQMIVRSVRKNFHAVRVQGLDRLRAELDADDSGLIFAANHSCWWDVFLAHTLNESIPVDGYGMMEHFNLRRFRFFQRIGAYSVDRANPSSLRESLRYTVELLARRRAGIWVFPQGLVAPNNDRPLVFQPGLRALLNTAGRLRIVPVELKFEFWQEQKPEVFVRFGTPVWVERQERATILTDWAQRVTEELDALGTDVQSQDPDRFTILLRGPTSMNERYARIRARFQGKTPGAPDAY